MNHYTEKQSLFAFNFTTLCFYLSVCIPMVFSLLNWKMLVSLNEHRGITNFFFLSSILTLSNVWHKVIKRNKKNVGIL